MSIQHCSLIELPKIADPRGNLTFIEGAKHIPFEIKRIYYLYDIPGGTHRAGHAHQKLHQVIVAMAGSFDITLNDGVSQLKVHLNRSYMGLYIPPMIWRDIDNFSSGAVCMAVASEWFDETDYYREFDQFLKAVAERGAK